MNATDALETYELLRPVVEAMNKQFVADSLVDNGDGTYAFGACETLWLTIGHPLVIDGVTYKITDVEVNESVTVSGPSLPTSTTFNIYPFYFVHGTLLAQVEETNMEENAWNKLPMIWLHEVTEEQFDRNPENNVGRTSPCDFYFMVDCDIENWRTVDHYRNAIRAMRNLTRLFINAVIASNITLLDRTDNYFHRMRDHARFGEYLNQGHERKWFNDDMSGTRLQIEIPFKKTQCCDGCCAHSPFAAPSDCVFLDSITDTIDDNDGEFVDNID